MEYKVAPSYQHMTIKKINPVTKQAIVEEKCFKCGGSGEYLWFGPCFTCCGSGVIRKTVKLYTEEEYDKYIAAAEKAKAKKKADAEKAAEKAKIDLLIKKGFDPENPTVYLVVGENTFSIKDILKESGACFKKDLGWYFTSKKEVPEGYFLLAFPFEEVFTWYASGRGFDLNENIIPRIKEQIANSLPPSSSDFVGEINERLKNIAVVVSKINTMPNYSYYGGDTTYIYTFKNDDNIIVWMTSSSKSDIKVGDKLFLTGTVKDHVTYNGVKQTKVNRCIIKERN